MNSSSFLHTNILLQSASLVRMKIWKFLFVFHPYAPIPRIMDESFQTQSWKTPKSSLFQLSGLLRMIHPQMIPPTRTISLTGAPRPIFSSASSSKKWCSQVPGAPALPMPSLLHPGYNAPLLHRKGIRREHPTEALQLPAVSWRKPCYRRLGAPVYHSHKPCVLQTFSGSVPRQISRYGLVQIRYDSFIVAIITPALFRSLLFFLSQQSYDIIRIFLAHCVGIDLLKIQQ